MEGMEDIETEQQNGLNGSKKARLSTNGEEVEYALLPLDTKKRKKVMLAPSTIADCVLNSLHPYILCNCPIKEGCYKFTN
jgi:hypothetical protein